MKQLLQETLNYLATRPYQEVFQLINKIISQMQNLDVQEKVAKETVHKTKGPELPKPIMDK